MDVRAVRCWRDNHAWIVEGPNGAVVVDPTDGAAVRAALGGVRLRAIWCTHHHPDHVAGVEALVGGDPTIPVVASVYDAGRLRVPLQTEAVDEGDALNDGGAGLPPARAMLVPGHTLGAVAFVFATHVFTGDTLFGAGCGRLFEGTAAQLRDSLARLRALPADTVVCCGHDYTSANLDFSRRVAPGDAAIAARQAGATTSTIAEERASNLFLRWDDPSLEGLWARLAAEEGAAPPRDPDDRFAALRRAKDRA